MKVHHILLLFLLISGACSRNSGGNSIPPQLQAKITGKWTINTVTLYYFDSTGATYGTGKFVDTVPNSYYYEFNSNSTWMEVLADSLSINGIGGTYTITSDSSFSLVNSANPIPEACQIDTLT